MDWILRYIKTYFFFLASYLTDRTQCISADGHSSHRTRLPHRVPQGSVLGPLLFTVYCAGLSNIFETHGVRYHVYADDTQLYVDFPPNDSASAADQISRCVIDVKAWLASRYLLLNEAKTETILFTTPNHRTLQPRPLVIDICGRNVTTSASIRDLGVHLDSTLSMTAHVSRTCRTAYAQLRFIAQIRTSRLDFGNAALYGITGTLLYRLEMVQRSAARVILRLHDQHSMTEALRELHWLPVTQRIDFKLLTFMHSAVHANIPRYLADRITPYVPHRSLRSADQALVCVPKVNLKRFGGDEPFHVRDLHCGTRFHFISGNNKIPDILRKT